MKPIVIILSIALVLAMMLATLMILDAPAQIQKKVAPAPAPAARLVECEILYTTEGDWNRASRTHFKDLGTGKVYGARLVWGERGDIITVDLNGKDIYKLSE